MSKSPQHISTTLAEPVSLPLPATHEPDDIDREIFERLDLSNEKIMKLEHDIEDVRAAQELSMEQSSKLYQQMLEMHQEMRNLSESVRAMAQLVLDDEYVPEPANDPEDEEIVIPSEPRIAYGDGGRTRRMTPVDKITISDWDGNGIRIRFSRDVWNEAGMPIHEGAKIVVDDVDGLMMVRAADEGDKGIGLAKINDQSIYIQTTRFTTTRSDFHPKIREIRPGSILVDKE